MAAPEELIGAPVDAIDTPFLLLDLDIFEANIAHMSAYCRDHGRAWRPHSKAHKCPDIARMQQQAGAVGITCAKLSEAALMAANGIDSILLANQLTAPPKWQRLARLQESAQIIASIDDADVVPMAAEAARRAGCRLPVVVEVDIGMGRTGARPGEEALAIAQRIAASDALEFMGLMGYEGHVLTLWPEEEKERACNEALDHLLHTRELLRARGLSSAIVSAGGTGSFAHAARHPALTEVQAGGGIFMDLKYRDEFHVPDLDIALFLVASVTSRRPGQIVLDAGFKSMSAHHGPPQVLGAPGLELQYLSAEHGVFSVRPGTRLPALGERLELALGYSDSTTFLHDAFWGARRGRLERIFPIRGRGLLT